MPLTRAAVPRQYVHVPSASHSEQPWGHCAGEGRMRAGRMLGRRWTVGCAVLCRACRAVLCHAVVCAACRLHAPSPSPCATCVSPSSPHLLASGGGGVDCVAWAALSAHAEVACQGQRIGREVAVGWRVACSPNRPGALGRPLLPAGPSAHRPQPTSPTHRRRRGSCRRCKCR